MRDIELARRKVSELARFFVGVKESSPNRGPLIELFQKAVDGKAEGEPYCAGFVHFLCQQIDQEMEEEDPTWLPYSLWKSESTRTMWDLGNVKARHTVPQLGDVIIWAHWKRSVDIKTKKELWIPTRQGHCGFVVELLEDGFIKTVEANTSSPSNGSIVRDGDGIWEKTRQPMREIGAFRYLGCLSPWV